MICYSMSACNKFSESIVHMACRRADFETVDYILRHGGDTGLVDDYGRTPLHDACWRSAPRFDVVTLLLDRNIDLLRMIDVRGANALKYICQDHWLQWCAYFFHQKDKYWPPINNNTNHTTGTLGAHRNSSSSISLVANNNASRVIAQPPQLPRV